MEYTKFLTRARELRANQVSSEHAFLELLIQQEEAVLDWKKPKSKYSSWDDLLRGERFCTLTMYRDYKKARSLITQPWIKKLGVYASVNIARLDDKARQSVMKSVRSWYNEHSVAPTYQLVSQYVKHLDSFKKAKGPTKMAKMTAYIKICQDLLKRHGIAFPKETWK
jgi:hypothetical protein